MRRSPRSPRPTRETLLTVGDRLAAISLTLAQQYCRPSARGVATSASAAFAALGRGCRASRGRRPRLAERGRGVLRARARSDARSLPTGRSRGAGSGSRRRAGDVAAPRRSLRRPRAVRSSPSSRPSADASNAGSPRVWRSRATVSTARCWRCASSKRPGSRCRSSRRRTSALRRARTRGRRRRDARRSSSSRACRRRSTSSTRSERGGILELADLIATSAPVGRDRGVLLVAERARGRPRSARRHSSRACCRSRATRRTLPICCRSCARSSARTPQEVRARLIALGRPRRRRRFRPARCPSIACCRGCSRRTGIDGIERWADAGLELAVDAPRRGRRRTSGSTRARAAPSSRRSRRRSSCPRCRGS